MDTQKSYESSMKGPVIYIRHARSTWNELLQKVTKKQAHCMVEFIDAPLSETGEMQTVQLCKDLASSNIKYAFCSPMLRCLQTAKLALKSQIEAKTVKIIVCPYLTEGVHGVHDYSFGLQKKKEDFNSDLCFDWSLFDKMFPQDQELFFLSYVDNVVDEETTNIINQLKLGSSTQLLKQFVDHYSSHDTRPESLKHLRTRSKTFKKWLNKFLSDVNYSQEKDGNVLVFTHSAFIRLTTTNCTEIGKGYPEDCYEAKNCELVTIDIKDSTDDSVESI